MLVKILAVISCVVVSGVGCWLFCAVIDFIVNVPNQLKRIADALEKEKKDGK